MKYVIIGGVAAGMSAAMEIVRTDRTADITVLEKGKDYSYGQCGLPYVIGGLVPSTNDVIARSVNTFREKYGIDARIHTNVTKVDPDLQQVSGINLEDGSSFMIEYDRLLIATGVDSLAPDWQGIHLSGIHSLKTLQDTKQIKEDLTKEINEVTVVGGGYIGLEMAENFVHLDKKVRLIQRGKQLAPIFDKDMATIIEQKAKEKGIEIILEEEVQSFRGNHRVEAVETDKQTYTTDLVLLSIGVTPNTSFLKNTGIHRNDKGALVVNRYMQTSIPNVYAAGDCATQYHIVKQLDDHFPLGTTANKQGRIAGANMADHRLTFKGIVGTSIIKFFDLTLGRTGLTEQEAKNLQIAYAVETITASDHAGYYPGTEKMDIKLVYHKENNLLLGAQIIGKAGVDKRIDVLATALYNNMTVEQLTDLDLAYAPPYNGVWDPIQQMARKI